MLETAQRHAPDARRVLLTTYHDLASIVDGLHSGAIEKLVQKPFTVGELLSAILPESMLGDSKKRTRPESLLWGQLAHQPAEQLLGVIAAALADFIFVHIFIPTQLGHF